MRAFVEESILDKILKTPVGEQLTLTPPEGDAILAGQIHRFSLAICEAILKGEDFYLLGRKIHVDYDA